MCEWEIEERDPSEFRLSCVCGNRPDRNRRLYSSWTCMQCGRLWSVAQLINKYPVPIPDDQNFYLFDPVEDNS